MQVYSQYVFIWPQIHVMIHYLTGTFLKLMLFLTFPHFLFTRQRGEGCFTFCWSRDLKTLTRSCGITVMFMPLHLPSSHLSNAPYSNREMLSNKDECRPRGTVIQVPITGALGLFCL